MAGVHPKTLFIINTGSGSGAAQERWLPAIKAAFSNNPGGYEWYEMKGKDDDQSLAHYINSWQPERVVAVGGDGTLKFVAENMLHSKIPIGFLPAGSANGMALELCLPADTEACLHEALHGAPKPMDVVCINGHISIHLSDLGLNAQLVKFFEHAPVRGMLGYALQFFKVLRMKEQMQLRITCGKETFTRTAWMAVLANGAHYGTGAVINPESSLQDGRFELILFKRLWFWELLKMALRRGRPRKKNTEIISCEAVNIHTGAPSYFQVDGEYIGEAQDVQAKVIRHAVQVVSCGE